jgi:hypothetical protein
MFLSSDRKMGDEEYLQIPNIVFCSDKDMVDQ